jgi:hypothetical protein
VVEYAKKYSVSKYCHDKIKIVLFSLIYCRHLLNKINNAGINIPSMIIARLEGEILLLHFTNKGWFVLEKVSDVDIPSSI